MLTTILIIVLILILIGGLPQFGLAPGYGPSGLVGLVLVVVLILFLMDKL